jgi:DNA polymerase sigma
VSTKLADPNPLEIKSPNLGMLFIEFLNFYANLDYMSVDIAPFHPDQKINNTPYPLKMNKYDNSITIVDPLNPMNNVARSTHKFFYLRVQGYKLERAYFLYLSSRLFP